MKNKVDIPLWKKIINVSISVYADGKVTHYHKLSGINRQSLINYKQGIVKGKIQYGTAIKVIKVIQEKDPDYKHLSPNQVLVAAGFPAEEEYITANDDTAELMLAKKIYLKLLEGGLIKDGEDIPDHVSSMLDDLLTKDVKIISEFNKKD